MTAQATTHYALKIERDQLNDGLQEWFDIDGRLGTVSYKHSRYILGEVEIDDPSTFLSELAADNDSEGLLDALDVRREATRDRLGSMEKDNWRELDDQLDNRFDARRDKLAGEILERTVVVLPLYLYDHSGLTISTSPFSCRWDSGQVGYIHTTFEQVFDNCSPQGLVAVLFPDRTSWDSSTSPNTLVYAGADIDAALAEIEQAFTTRTPNATLTSAVEASLRGEVQTMDDYLTGNVWWFQLYELELDPDDMPDDWDEMDADDRRTYIIEKGDSTDSCGGFVGSDLQSTGMKFNLDESIPDLDALLDAAWDKRS
jgi:hypothetical protein